MNVKKFTAATSREALRKVREALGPDAVILSNRPVDGVVEILALANEENAAVAVAAPEPEPTLSRSAMANIEQLQQMQQFQQMQQQAQRAQAQQAQQAQQMSAQPDSYVERRVAPAAPAYAPAPEFDMSALQLSMTSQMQSMMQAAIAQAKDSASAEMSGMMSELRAMRGMMETQLAELSWSSTSQREPHKAAVLRQLLAAGFSVSLARLVIDKLPAGKSLDESLAWIKTVLARNLSTVGNEDELLEKGGVFALVGPTGVGKTTSTAKLAARCVMRHGPEKLALITTDAYRIGGHEQLRIYGKILGVMVHSVKDEADLRIALKELRNKHTVLIDTVGVSQRDRNVAEQVAMLSESGANVKRLLCLNATSTNETLNEVVRAYQGTGLAGCIMTKLDEAASIGNVLDVIIRQKLTMYYVSNGQRVPEDLHLADRATLVDRAFRLKKDGAAQYLEDELPLLMAQAATIHNDRSLREVSFG